MIAHQSTHTRLHTLLRHSHVRHHVISHIVQNHATQLQNATGQPGGTSQTPRPGQ